MEEFSFRHRHNRNRYVEIDFDVMFSFSRNRNEYIELNLDDIFDENGITHIGYYFFIWMFQLNNDRFIAFITNYKFV